MISVVIGVPEAAMIEFWEGLRQRAGANVFLHPVALCAASALGFAHIHVLTAWVQSATSRKLVGFWALRERRVAPFWLRCLAAPPYEYSFVSSPVIDPAYINDVVPAFFDAIEKHPALPNVIQIRSLDGDADTGRAIIAAIGARKGQMLTLSEHARPFLNGESERKRSGSTGKKLRQDWNRLSALGAVDIINERSPDNVRDAFEVFLDMEEHSWKGAGGTALLSEDEDAAFARRLIGDLAARGDASVALLRIDGRPIAAQVLLYSGDMAYTWKIAFDAEFARYSPGTLLVDKVSDELFAHGIKQIESCSGEGGFLEHMWTGRRLTLDLLVDVGAQKSLSFVLAAMAERGYARLRETRNRLRAVTWLTLPKRKSLAVTRS